MFDAFLDPVRLCWYLDFTVVVPQLLVETVLLPHALEVSLGVDHDQPLPSNLALLVVSQHLCHLQSGGRRRPVDQVGVHHGIVERSVDEQLRKAEASVGRQDCKSAELDVRFGWVLSLLFLAGWVCIGVFVRLVLVDVLVRSVGRRNEPNRRDGNAGGGGRGASRVVSGRVARVGAAQCLRGVGCVGGNGSISDPVPAAGIVFVELGFKRHALLAIDFFADGHGIAEVLRDVDLLFAAGYCVVIAIKGAFERADSVDKLSAGVGRQQRRTIWRAKAAFQYAGHGDDCDGVAVEVCRRCVVFRRGRCGGEGVVEAGREYCNGVLGGSGQGIAWQSSSSIRAIAGKPCLSEKAPCAL